ncbi:unnamed protein product [Acanthosepion pharaonis]|uniref:Uncharacterized protein n=1 Tax=Acanthosepion pharaonis TaxID=158019 RepID=A0A812EL78_ACAPH|nr:unnamed protein product [Sepia pharaonis]
MRSLSLVHRKSLKFRRHLITLYFRWLPLELFFLSLLRFHLITLYIRCCWNSFPSINSGSLKFCHLITLFHCLPLELFFSIKAIIPLWSLKFRHLITLSFVSLTLFPPSKPSIKFHYLVSQMVPLFSSINHYESLYHALLSLVCLWTLSLHQSHLWSLKFRHLITLNFLWNSFPPSKDIEFSFRHPRSTFVGFHSLHQSHYESQIESLKFFGTLFPPSSNLIALLLSHYESLKIPSSNPLYFRWLPLELFSSIKAIISLSNSVIYPRSTFVGCLWNSFPSIKAIVVSQIPLFSSIVSQIHHCFRWLPLALFSPHQSHYGSLKFRHLITLSTFVGCLWNSFLHQSHYESLRSSSNHALLSTLFLHQSHYGLRFRHLIALLSLKRNSFSSSNSLRSSNHSNLVAFGTLFLHQSHYGSLKFRYLITLYSLVAFELFSSIKAIYESLKFRHLITLYFLLFFPPFVSQILSAPGLVAHSFPYQAIMKLFSLHQSHYRSLKFCHLITLYFHWLPLELFSSIKAIMGLKFRHLITLIFRWLPLELFSPSIMSLSNSVINHALFSLVAFRTLFPPSNHVSQIQSSNHALLSLVAFELFSLHQRHYESLKFVSFRHLITLYFLLVCHWLFSLHQSHYESLKFQSSNHALLSLVALWNSFPPSKPLSLSEFCHLIKLCFRWFCLWNSFPPSKPLCVSLKFSHYESLKFRHLITLYFRWFACGTLFPSIKAIMVSQIPSSNRSLLSLVAFGTLFPPSKPCQSQIPSSNPLCFRWLPFGTLFLHQNHYESLQFRHLITLYFRWLPLELFSLHQSHYSLSNSNSFPSIKAIIRSLKIPSSNPLYFRWLPFRTLFLIKSHYGSLNSNSFPSIKSHYESLKFRHHHALLSLVAFGTLFPSIKAIMSLSNSLFSPPSKPLVSQIGYLITLCFRWLPFWNSFPSIKAINSLSNSSSNHALLSLVSELFPSQSRMESLKFRHLITLSTFVGCLWNSFPPSKAIMGLSNSPLWVSQIPSLITLLFVGCLWNLFPSIKGIMSLKFRHLAYLLSLFAFWNSFPPSKPLWVSQILHYGSLKFRHLITLLLSLAFGTLFPPSKPLWSLKFRHLITLYFRWLPLELFSLHQSHYESQIPSSNQALAFVGCLWNSFPPSKPLTFFFPPSKVSQIPHYESLRSHLNSFICHALKFHLGCLWNSFLFLIKAIMVSKFSLKFRHLIIALLFRWLPLELFSLHQSHYDSLKFRHLIRSTFLSPFRHLIALFRLPLELFPSIKAIMRLSNSSSNHSTFVGCLWNSFPPSKPLWSLKFPIMSLSNSSSNHALFRWLPFGTLFLHQSHWVSQIPSSNPLCFSLVFGTLFPPSKPFILKFVIITLYFRWLPLELFPSIKAIMSLSNSLYFRWFFGTLFPPSSIAGVSQIQSSNHALLSLVCLWNSFLILHMSLSIPSSIEALSLWFKFRPSKSGSLFSTFVGCLWNSFPPSKAIMVSQIPSSNRSTFVGCLGLFSLHQTIMSLSQIPSSNHALFSLVAFGISFLFSKFHLIRSLSFGCLWPLSLNKAISHYESLKLRHLITLNFRWLPLEIFSLHQRHYESLKFRHLITLNFRWLPLEFFSLHQSHYESLKFRHLITLYFRWLPLELFSPCHYGLSNSSSNPLSTFVGCLFLFLHQSHYESLKFRHLITLYFRWLPLEFFSLHQAIMSLSNSFAFELFPLHQSHYESLKFRHLITFHSFVGCLLELFFPSIKAVMSLKFRHLITLYSLVAFELFFSLHQSHYESLKFPSSNHALLSLVVFLLELCWFFSLPSNHYDLSKFQTVRSLSNSVIVTLYFRWLPFGTLFPSIKAIMSLKFCHLITLSTFVGLPLELSLHFFPPSNHAIGCLSTFSPPSKPLILKFRHALLSFGCLWNSFPPSKHYESHQIPSSNHALTFVGLCLHQELKFLILHRTLSPPL